MNRGKLVAAIAGVAALVIASAIVLLLGVGKQSAAPPPATPVPSRIDPAGTTPTPTASPGVPGGEAQPMPGDQTNQVAVANAYLKAFLQPGTPAQRESRLKDWATPAHVKEAAQVSNDRLPQGQPKGSATLDPASSQPNQAYAHVQLSDDTWWGIGLVKDLTAPKQWRVTFLEKEGH